MNDRTVAAEEWRPVESYEARYEISSLGRVRSLPKGNILAGSVSKRGYRSVALSQDGIAKTRYVHHLVAYAFIGPRPDSMDICHNNGIPGDCCAVNLRYDTRNANMRDAIEQGTHRSVGRSICIHGHALTPENTLRYERLSSDGAIKHRIRCRECMRLKSARWNEKVRLQRLSS